MPGRKRDTTDVVRWASRREVRSPRRRHGPVRRRGVPRRGRCRGAARRTLRRRSGRPTVPLELHRVVQRVGDHSQHCITGRVTVDVVEVLESVDVDHQHRDRRLHAGGARRRRRRTCAGCGARSSRPCSPDRRSRWPFGCVEVRTGTMRTAAMEMLGERNPRGGGSCPVIRGRHTDRWSVRVVGAGVGDHHIVDQCLDRGRVTRSRLADRNDRSRRRRILESEFDEFDRVRSPIRCAVRLRRTRAQLEHEMLGERPTPASWARCNTVTPTPSAAASSVRSSSDGVASAGRRSMTASSAR